MSSWVVLVPLKPPAVGKSRLRLPGVDHEEVARAIGQDTLEAVFRCEAVREVVVVSADSGWHLGTRGRFVAERAPQGIDAAIELGDSPALRKLPRAVVVGDLAGLRPAELSEALNAAARVQRAVVADRDGTGTTMVTALPGLKLVHRFGPQSLSRHVAAGSVELQVPIDSSLRLDIDTVADLPQEFGPHLGRVLNAARNR